jgi:hypothetical protein
MNTEKTSVEAQSNRDATSSVVSVRVHYVTSHTRVYDCAVRISWQRENMSIHYCFDHNLTTSRYEF